MVRATPTANDPVALSPEAKSQIMNDFRVEGAILETIRKLALWRLDTEDQTLIGSRRDLEINIINDLANSDWNPTLAGRCIGKKIGVWVGRPLPYSTRIHGLDSDEDRRVKPVVAARLGFTPNAYFSVLIGMTYMNVPVSITNTENTAKTGAFAFTVGVGGNLDILTALMR